MVLILYRLLKGLGAPKSARIYNAGGEPFGGREALQPLVSEFPNLVTKEMLAKEGELTPFMNKSSALAAIDYIVSLSSNVFVPSHGGNMGRAMQVLGFLNAPQRLTVYTNSFSLFCEYAICYSIPLVGFE